MANAAKSGAAARGQTGTEREVPLPRFNETTVEQAAKRLRRLSPDKLRRVRAYEQATMNALLEGADRLLATIPASELDFDRAKAAVIERVEI